MKEWVERVVGRGRGCEKERGRNWKRAGGGGSGAMDCVWINGGCGAKAMKMGMGICGEGQLQGRFCQREAGLTSTNRAGCLVAGIEDRLIEDSVEWWRTYYGCLRLRCGGTHTRWDH